MQTQSVCRVDDSWFSVEERTRGYCLKEVGRDTSWGNKGLGTLVYATKGDCEIDSCFLFALGAVLLEAVEIDWFRGSQAWLGNRITWSLKK